MSKSAAAVETAAAADAMERLLVTAAQAHYQAGGELYMLPRLNTEGVAVYDAQDEPARAAAAALVRAHAGALLADALTAGPGVARPVLDWLRAHLPPGALPSDLSVTW
jgi:hypothetical protein